MSSSVPGADLEKGNSLPAKSENRGCCWGGRICTELKKIGSFCWEYDTIHKITTGVLQICAVSGYYHIHKAYDAGKTASLVDLGAAFLFQTAVAVLVVNRMSESREQSTQTTT